MNYLKYLREKFSDLYDFDEFLEEFRRRCGASPDYTTIASTLVDANALSTTREQQAMTAHVVFQCLNFMHYGQPLFEIRPALADMLMNTHLKKVPKDIVKMPFPSMQLEVPYGILKSADDTGKEFNLMSVFVCYDPTRSSKMRILGNFDPTDKSIRHDDLNHFYVLDFNNGDNVEEIINSIKSYDPLQHHSEGFIHQFDTYVKTSFAFIINCILYITNSEADIVRQDRAGELRKKLKNVKSPGKRKKIERQISNAGSGRYVVGSKIKVSRNEPKEHTPPSGETHGKHAYQYKVMGHWRHAHGKHIWIKPHLRGPELAEIINKPYIVG